MVRPVRGGPRKGQLGRVPCPIGVRPCFAAQEFERKLGRWSDLKAAAEEADPRRLMADFYRLGDSRGPRGSLAGEEPDPKEATRWFAVYRPCSSDSIRKMYGKVGVGKGLNVKGKSAKKNRLSGFVPFIQISDNNHKKEVEDAPRDARTKIFFRSPARDTARVNKLAREQAEKSLDKVLKEASLKIDDPSVKVISDYAPWHAVPVPLAGDQVFLLPFNLPSSVSELRTTLAPLLGVAPERLTLLCAGVELQGGVEIVEVDALTLRSPVDRPVLCRRTEDYDEHAHDRLRMNVHRLPEGEMIQALEDRGRWRLIYTSKEVLVEDLYAIDDPAVEPWGFFPLAPRWPMPAGASPPRRAAPSCDVWSCQLALPVKGKLDAHASKTNDRPIPRYQMIVDPNLFVHQQLWVPSEFDITKEGSCRLVGGERSHLEPQLAKEVAQPVLEAALPLLAKLRRPQLLLEDRRLQVVFKERVVSVLSAGYDIVRALQHRGVSIQRCPEAVGLVLEFLHLRPSEARRKLMRIDRLREQLQPSGEFCGSSQVVHAGNACFTMIGWLHNMLDKGGLEIFDKAPHWIGKKLLKGLDLPPKQLGRGMSEILSLGTKELENRLKEQEHQLHEVEHQLQEVEDDRHGMKSLKLVVPQRFHCRLLSLKKACPTVELQIPKACVGSDGATALKVIGVGVKEDAEKNLAAHLPAKHVVKVEDEWVCCHCRGLKKSDFHGKGVINAQHVKDKHLSVGQKVTVLDASGHGSVTVLKKAIRSERNNQIGFLDDGTQVEIMGHWLECRWAIRPSHGYSPSQLGFIPAQSIEKDEHVSLQGPVKECFAALAMFQEELGMEIDAFSLGGEPVKLQPQPRRKPKLKK
eukprot:g31506.t1